MARTARASAATSRTRIGQPVLRDARRRERQEAKARNKVPTGVAVSLTQDVAIRRWAKRDNNIVYWSEFERGGHFAALEVPEFLVGDVRKFFRRLR